MRSAKNKSLERRAEMSVWRGVWKDLFPTWRAVGVSVAAHWTVSDLASADGFAAVIGMAGWARSALIAVYVLAMLRSIGKNLNADGRELRNAAWGTYGANTDLTVAAMLGWAVVGVYATMYVANVVKMVQLSMGV